ANSTVNVDRLDFGSAAFTGSIVAALNTAKVHVGEKGTPGVGGNVHATGNVDMDASVMLTITTVDDADGTNASANVDAAVAITTVFTRAEIGIYGTSTVDAGGALTIDADSDIDVTSSVDGAGGTAGATLAVTVADIET